MCWCPITNLDIANEAYEWNMGVTRSDLDDATTALSKGLADAHLKNTEQMLILKWYGDKDIQKPSVATKLKIHLTRTSSNG